MKCVWHPQAEWKTVSEEYLPYSFEFYNLKETKSNRSKTASFCKEFSQGCTLWRRPFAWSNIEMGWPKESENRPRPCLARRGWWVGVSTVCSWWWWSWWRGFQSSRLVWSKPTLEQLIFLNTLFYLRYSLHFNLANATFY